MTVQQDAIQKIKAFSSMNEAHQLAIISQNSAKKLKSLCAILTPLSVVETPSSTATLALSESATNTSFLKIKDRLLFWGPFTLSRSLTHSVEYNYEILTTDSTREQKMKLAKSIKSQIHRVTVNERR